MKTTKQRALDELVRVASNNRRIGDLPLMGLVEAVNALDAAGLLNGPFRKDRASVAAEEALRNGIEEALKNDDDVDSLANAIRRVLDEIDTTDAALEMCELVHSAEAAIAALSDEGFPGRNIEAQVRSLISAWSEERAAARNLRATDNAGTPSSPLRTRVELALKHIDSDDDLRLHLAKVLDIRDDSEPIDPDTPIPYTVVTPQPDAPAKPPFIGVPCVVCKQPRDQNDECTNPSCSVYVLPF